MVSEAEPDDVRTELFEAERRCVLRQRVEIHCEEVHRGFTVDVVELVVGSLLLIVLLIITECSEVPDIVRALRVDTLVDIEVLAVFDLDQSTLTVRAAKSVLLPETVLSRSEQCAADFALELSLFTVVAVEVVMRSTALRTDAVFGDVADRAFTALDGLDDLAVPLAIVVDETFLGPAVLMVLELGKDVGLELLVLGRLGVIESELFQRDILGDERHQPGNLSVKVIDFIEK